MSVPSFAAASTHQSSSSAPHLSFEVYRTVLRTVNPGKTPPVLLTQ